MSNQETMSAVGEFLCEAEEALQRLHEQRGLRRHAHVWYSFIDDEPERGRDGLLYPRQHRGPQVRIALVLTDPARLSELKDAYYPHNLPGDTLLPNWTKEATLCDSV